MQIQNSSCATSQFYGPLEVPLISKSFQIIQILAQYETVSYGPKTENTPLYAICFVSIALIYKGIYWPTGVNPKCYTVDFSKSNKVEKDVFRIFQ